MTRDERTQALIDKARLGSKAAVQLLFAEHRTRLRRAIAMRIDKRIAARLDPSDIVQEALIAANEQLPSFLETQPMPFYCWLRRVALDRLAHQRRMHLAAAKRTVAREEPLPSERSHDDVACLARRLCTREVSPSGQAMRSEMQGIVRAALASLSLRDHEILLMKYVQQLTLREAAAQLEISESAAKARHIRALARFSRAVAVLRDES